MSCVVSPDNKQSVTNCSRSFQAAHGTGRSGGCQHSDAALWEAGPLEVCLVGDRLVWEGQESKETQVLIIL